MELHPFMSDSELRLLDLEKAVKTCLKKAKAFKGGLEAWEWLALADRCFKLQIQINNETIAMQVINVPARDITRQSDKQKSLGPGSPESEGA